MRTKLFVKKYVVCVIMRSTFQYSNIDWQVQCFLILILALFISHI